MPLYGEAKRRYQRQWMARRRQAWIDSKGGCCVKCGSTEALEVDHIDPAKKTMQPAGIWSRTASVAFAELANCQVLCDRCHLDKTLAAIVHAPHGTDSRYQFGCKCHACKAAHAVRARAYRARRREAIAA